MAGHLCCLPTELLLRIVGECYSPSGLQFVPLPGRRKRRAWLASTATVSRFWLAIVYPVLYHIVGLHTHRSTRLFLRTLVRNPSVALHVARLSFIGHPQLNASAPVKRWRWRLSRPLVLRLERTDCELGEPRLAKWYAEIARRCPRVRRCNVGFEHLQTVFWGDGPGNQTTIRPWTTELVYLHVTDIPASIPLALPLPPAPRLLHLTLVWTRPSWRRALHQLAPAHLAGFAQLERLDLFSLRIDEGALRAVLRALRPALRSLKACSVTVTAGWDRPRSTVAPAEWLGGALGDSHVFEELYLCRRHMPVGLVRPLAALRSVRCLTLDLQHLPLGYVRGFYPPAVQTVRFVAGSTCRSSTGLGEPCVFARHAWRLIAMDRDAGCVPQLATVTIAIPSRRAEDTRLWVLLSFLLTAAARRRDLEFKLNLYILHVAGGDTFRWEQPPLPPSRKERVRTVLNRLLHLTV